VQWVETTSKIVTSENDNNQTLINGRGVANHPGHTSAIHCLLLWPPIPSPRVCTANSTAAAAGSVNQDNNNILVHGWYAAKDQRPMTEKYGKRNNEKNYQNNITTGGQCSSSPLIQYGPELSVSFSLCTAQIRTRHTARCSDFKNKNTRYIFAINL